jgi:hypothetical protein
MIYQSAIPSPSNLVISPFFKNLVTMSTSGDLDPPGPPPQEINVEKVSAWIAFVLIVFFTFVYCIDYYLVKLPLDQDTSGGSKSKSRSKLNNSAGKLRVEDNTCKGMVGRLIQRVTNLTSKDLHYLILASFVSSILSGLFSALDVDQGDPRSFSRTKEWITSLDIAFYAILKAVQTSFFIARYQLASAKDMASHNTLIIPGLWLLNFLGFSSMFVSLLSNPPYVEVISPQAGLATTILFIISDCSANLIVMFLLISPLSAHVHSTKQRLQREGKLSFVGSSTSSRSNLNLALLGSSFRSVQDDFDEIIRMEKIVNTAVMTCAASISFTMIENIVYCMAFYVYPTTHSSEVYIWGDLYIWTSVIELTFCSLAPVCNYPRFKEMWRLEGLWKSEIAGNH